MKVKPTRELEKHYLNTYPLVAGMDEVGRGALAGPVAVGIAVVGPDTPDEFPSTLADSKMLTPKTREALIEPVRQWVKASAVGYASAGEVDQLGIVGALRQAGRRALKEVIDAGFTPALVLLDGVHDWLRPGEVDLLSQLSAQTDDLPPSPPVVTAVKGDASSAVIAAASVLAKVSRDDFMRQIPDPGYDWAANKGYASPSHIAALKKLGASHLHRRSWNLPGLSAK